MQADKKTDREIEKQQDVQINRETDIYRMKQTHKQRGTETDRYIDKQINKETGINIDRQTDIQSIDRLADTLAYRQSRRQIDKQQTDRQEEKDKKILPS